MRKKEQEQRRKETKEERLTTNAAQKMIQRNFGSKRNSINKAQNPIVQIQHLIRDSHQRLTADVELLMNQQENELREKIKNILAQHSARVAKHDMEAIEKLAQPDPETRACARFSALKGPGTQLFRGSSNAPAATATTPPPGRPAPPASGGSAGAVDAVQAVPPPVEAGGDDLTLEGVDPDSSPLPRALFKSDEGTMAGPP